MSPMERVLLRAKKSSDVVLAVVMAAIVAALIVPLPEWLLDLGLAINLTAALCLLVAALYAKDALKVAAFPTLLLVTTLFRLAMNVSSTRLALSEGHAGEVIAAFGEFVVRGDYVVGAVIFAILTLVQFLVVAKGAERVAEVSARFTLDAMPGKQMSIDADLRAGAINQAQARARRRELERESQLFGSMDGAMKFVKGDVIAGLVITLVNLLGGLVIGVAQNGMTVADAASTYALIAIGDGLVSQIPSLCIAVAAGLVVTRVSSEGEDSSLGADIGSQFFGQWKALWVVSALCLALGLMPGMPHLTFALIAAAGFATGYALKKIAERPVPPAPSGSQANPESQPATEQTFGVAALTVDLGSQLSASATALQAELERVRERLYAELGVKVPGARVRTQAPLAANGYLFMFDEVPGGQGELLANRLYVSGSPVDLKLLGVGAERCADWRGREISNVSSEAAPKLAATRTQPRTAAQMMGEHLLAELKRRAGQWLGVQEVQALLEGFEKQAPALVREATTKVPLPLLTDVLRRLLSEQVSIRNLKTIFEALVNPATEGDAAALAERCRQALHRQLSHQHAPGGSLFAFLVDPAVEETLRQGGSQLAIEPSAASAILEGVKRICGQGRCVLLASPDVRRLLRRLVEGAFPEVAVVTFGELNSDLPIRPVGRLVAVG